MKRTRKLLTGMALARARNAGVAAAMRRAEAGARREAEILQEIIAENQAAAARQAARSAAGCESPKGATFRTEAP
jgi:hypothetical protein